MAKLNGQKILKTHLVHDFNIAGMCPETVMDRDISDTCPEIK